jgi:hypothetical protein
MFALDREGDGTTLADGMVGATLAGIEGDRFGVEAGKMWANAAL